MKDMEEVLAQQTKLLSENLFSSKEDAIYSMDRAVEGCTAYAHDILMKAKAGKLEGSKANWHAKSLATCMLSIDNMWRRYSRPTLAKEGKEND